MKRFSRERESERERLQSVDQCHLNHRSGDTYSQLTFPIRFHGRRDFVSNFLRHVKRVVCDLVAVLRVLAPLVAMRATSYKARGGQQQATRTTRGIIGLTKAIKKERRDKKKRSTPGHKHTRADPCPIISRVSLSLSLTHGRKRSCQVLFSPFASATR